MAELVESRCTFRKVVRATSSISPAIDLIFLVLDKVTPVKTIQRSCMMLLDVLVFLQVCGSNAIFPPPTIFYE
ncbi:MAG TPA: hypothetical protein VK566_01430 [Nitrososphaeraceae archaeon]|nr:hypothetical protein [Nitrososphaeraceae archaeon]